MSIGCQVTGSPGGIGYHFFLKFIFLVLLCVFMSMCVYAKAPARVCVWRADDNSGIGSRD